MSYQDLEIPTDGALSFSIENANSGKPWWWYLNLYGKPLYLLSNICGTCSAIFKRVQGKNLPLAPDQLSKLLGAGSDTVPQDVIETISTLLPKGRYIIGLLRVIPTLMKHADKPWEIGCNADYFWWHSHHLSLKKANYELLLPFVHESELNEDRIAFYKTKLLDGANPTALALSITYLRIPRGEFYQWALAHFLLDGHHKVMAASQLRKPITLLSLLCVNDMVMSPPLEESVRKYYAYGTPGMDLGS